MGISLFCGELFTDTHFPQHFKIMLASCILLDRALAGEIDRYYLRPEVQERGKKLRKQLLGLLRKIRFRADDRPGLKNECYVWIQAPAPQEITLPKIACKPSNGCMYLCIEHILALYLALLEAERSPYIARARCTYKNSFIGAHKFLGGVGDLLTVLSAEDEVKDFLPAYVDFVKQLEPSFLCRLCPTGGFRWNSDCIEQALWFVCEKNPALLEAKVVQLAKRLCPFADYLNSRDFSEVGAALDRLKNSYLVIQCAAEMINARKAVVGSGRGEPVFGEELAKNFIDCIDAGKRRLVSLVAGRKSSVLAVGGSPVAITDPGVAESMSSDLDLCVSVGLQEGDYREFLLEEALYVLFF